MTQLQTYLLLITAIVASLGLVATIWGWAYTHGKLTKTVETHGDDIADLRQRDSAQDDRLNNHSERIGRLEGMVAPKL